MRQRGPETRMWGVREGGYEGDECADRYRGIGGGEGEGGG